MNSNDVLEAYGFTSFFQTQITDEESGKGLVPARILNVQKERYQIVTEHGIRYAKLKSSVFFQNSALLTYPAVGDFVLTFYNPTGDDLIVRLLNRKSVFSRLNPSVVSISADMEQTVATNFDYIFIATSLNQDFNPRRLERYLSVAWESNATPILLLTKADLADEIPDLSLIAPGVDQFVVSSVTGQGIEELKAFLKPGKTYVIMGSSGIGKSSLLNKLSEKELMKVKEIRSDDDKGRHTTTYRQLFQLENGALFIDTPGMRVLGLLDNEDGVSESFQEIEDLAKQCKFADCKHESEPGCAVRAALEDGTLPMERFLSYQKLLKESRHAARKAEILRMKEKSRSQRRRA